MQQNTPDQDKNTDEKANPQPAKKSEWTEVTERSLEDIKQDSKEKLDRLPGKAQKKQ